MDQRTFRGDDGMSDLEYGEHYAVYVTPDKGVKFITNNVSIDTIDELRKGNYTVTELAAKLDVPVTTMQSNLTKLLRLGMVASQKDPEDHRKIRYVKQTYCLFRDGVLEDWMMQYKDYVAERIILQDDPWKAAIAMIVIVLLENGVDVRPLLFEFGNSMAYVFRNVARGMGVDEILDLAFSVFNIKDGTEYTMDAGDMFILTVRTTGDEPVFKVMYFMNAIIGFLFAALPWVQGYYYSNAIKVTMSEDRTQVLVTAPKKDGEVTLTHLPFLWDRTREFYKLSSPINVVRTDKGTLIIGNETMVSILERLNMGTRTAEELSNELDMPSVTVSSALRKLKAEGVVATDGKQRGARFSLAGKILISMTSSSHGFSDDMMWTKGVLIRALRSESQDISDLAYWYTYISWKMVGLDYEHIIRTNGIYIADKILDMNPGITADEFVRMACRCRVRDTVKAEPVTLIPLKVRVTCVVVPGYPSYAEVSRNYFWEILNEGLRRLTGTDYPIDMELVTVTRDGEELPLD